MEPTITTDIVVAYSQCPRKAYLLLFSPDQGEPTSTPRFLNSNGKRIRRDILITCSNTLANYEKLREG